MVILVFTFLCGRKILYIISPKRKKEAPTCSDCRQGASQKILCRYIVPSTFNKAIPARKVSDILPVPVIYIPFLRRQSRTLLSVTYSILSFRLLHTSPFFILQGTHSCRSLHAQSHLPSPAHTAIWNCSRPCNTRSNTLQCPLEGQTGMLYSDQLQPADAAPK